MLDALSASHLSLLEDELRLQAISQNISNMQTIGYKSKSLDANRFDESLQINLDSVSQHMTLSTETLQGELTQTRNPYELALGSEQTYFAVQSKNGIAYTRKGDFHVNAAGELENSSASVLLGKGGPIRVDDGHFQVTPSGAILLDNKPVGDIRVVTFLHPEDLNYQGDGLYVSEKEGLLATAPKVHQGYLEQSSVSSVDEMMQLIKTSRHFETSSRVMRTIDNLLSTAIHQLGESNV